MPVMETTCWSPHVSACRTTFALHCVDAWASFRTRHVSSCSSTPRDWHATGVCPTFVGWNFDLWGRPNSNMQKNTCSVTPWSVTPWHPFCQKRLEPLQNLVGSEVAWSSKRLCYHVCVENSFHKDLFLTGWNIKDSGFLPMKNIKDSSHWKY